MHPRVSVVIPFRGGGGRDESLALTRKQWPSDWEIHLCEAEPWSKAEAVAKGISLATGEIVVMSDSDLLYAVGAVEAAVQAVRNGAGWAQPFDHVCRLDEATTLSVLRGESPYVPEGNTPRKSTEAGGCVVATRETWLNIPLDVRFTASMRGEDTAHGLALSLLLGKPIRSAATAFHLWHEPLAEGRQPNGRYRLTTVNTNLLKEYQRCGRRRDVEEMWRILSRTGGIHPTTLPVIKRKPHEMSMGRAGPDTYEGAPFKLAEPIDSEEECTFQGFTGLRSSRTGLL